MTNLIEVNLFLINKFCRFALATCMFLIVQSALGVDFNNCSYGIAEFADKESILSILKSNDEISDFGMSIRLETEASTQKVGLTLNSGVLSFADFLKELKIYLQKNKTMIFPLFIDFNGDEATLTTELHSAGLWEKVFYQPTGERWPSTQAILAQNKQLIIFNFGKGNAENNPINSATQHLIDFSIDYNSSTKTKELNYNGSIQNELLLIRKFTTESLLKNEVPIDWNRISLNNYSIDYLLECWNCIGKRPNFLFFSELKYAMQFHYLAKTIQDYPSVFGQVYSGGKILNGIRWLHNKQSYTSGYFNFPYNHIETLLLSPIKQGYRFAPESIDASKSMSEKSTIEFMALPLQINDNLTASFSLDHSILNRVNPSEEYKQAKTFVPDSERGEVLKLANGEFVTLDNVADYKIVNSSFTISIYFKLIPTQGSYKYCILGSNEEGYRKGLHAVIQSGIPMFGFYTNDCTSSKHITPSKWHQLTLRYDITSETQSIFIDGEKIGESENHPSFIGTSELLLGHGIKQENYMNGYLADLNIWNRALSDEEIAWLNKNTLPLPEQLWKLDSNNSLALALLLLLVLSFAVFRFSKRTKSIQVIQPAKTDTDQFLKNSINLYGQFMVIDKDGNDHAKQFSPKTKELFLLLLLYTLKNPRGISTNELTEIIWAGFETEKAANNRGVTFNQLRKTLANINGIEVEYDNKYWRLVLSDEMVCDYKIALDFLATKKDDFAVLFEIIKRGEFLSGVTKEWLLEYKSTHNFDLIDKLLEYTKKLFDQKDYDKALEVATYIISLDDLNVQSLHFQLRALNRQGSGNKAAFLFDKFCQRYQSIHNKPFGYNLKQFLSLDVDSLWK